MDKARDFEGKKAAGLIIGPDGKPCKACTAFRDWTKSNPDRRSGDKSSLTSQVGSTAPAVQASATDNRANGPPPGCPPDVEQLGRATWTFLHTTAAYYPEKPTPTERANMLALLRALPVLYPCGWCAGDFRKDMDEHPPNVSSRVALSRWLCERHNTVNEKLGKERFDCSNTDERWKDGPSDGRCN